MDHKNKYYLKDCYFYYYSSCEKKGCPYRHEPTALGCETECQLWIKDKCKNVKCNLRHMHLVKNRKAIRCYWETQPEGCKKEHCPFKHHFLRFRGNRPQPIPRQTFMKPGSSYFGPPMPVISKKYGSWCYDPLQSKAGAGQLSEKNNLRNTHCQESDESRSDPESDAEPKTNKNRTRKKPSEEKARSSSSCSSEVDSNTSNGSESEGEVEEASCSQKKMKSKQKVLNKEVKHSSSSNPKVDRTFRNLENNPKSDAENSEEVSEEEEGNQSESVMHTENKKIKAKVNLYIKNIDEEIDEKRLWREFLPYGTVISAIVKTVRGRSLGYGFVCFSKPEQAKKAILKMNGRILGNKRLSVEYAECKKGSALKESELEPVYDSSHTHDGRTVKSKAVETLDKTYVHKSSSKNKASGEDKEHLSKKTNKNMDESSPPMNSTPRKKRLTSMSDGKESENKNQNWRSSEKSKSTDSSNWRSGLKEKWASTDTVQTPTKERKSSTSGDHNKNSIKAKKSLVLDITPCGSDIDMHRMEDIIRGIQKDGLTWGTSKIVSMPDDEISQKLQLICVLESGKITTGEVFENIREHKNHVKSVDISEFSKI